jgi:hypothetical protein
MINLRFAGRGALPAALLGLGIAASTPLFAEESADELSRQATDPTASLMSFGLIAGYTGDFYGDLPGYDDRTEIKFQPVIPFRAFGTSNILRVSMREFTPNTHFLESCSDRLHSLRSFGVTWLGMSRMPFRVEKYAFIHSFDLPPVYASGDQIDRIARLIRSQYWRTRPA